VPEEVNALQQTQRYYNIPLFLRMRLRMKMPCGRHRGTTTYLDFIHGKHCGGFKMDDSE
jgi:hypothetical protein